MTLTPIGLHPPLARSMNPIPPVKSILRNNDIDSFPSSTKNKKLPPFDRVPPTLYAHIYIYVSKIHFLKARASEESGLSIPLTMNFQGAWRFICSVAASKTAGRNEQQPIINLRFPGPGFGQVKQRGYWPCSHRQTIRQTSLTNRRFRVNTKFRQVFAASRSYQEKARSIPRPRFSLPLSLFIYIYTQPLGHFFSPSRISNGGHASITN